MRRRRADNLVRRRKNPRLALDAPDAVEALDAMKLRP
jgi:hypothetical protein